MAIPLLYLLGVSPRRAYPAIVKGVRLGLTRDVIGVALRSKGYQISNAVLGQIMRREKAALAHAYFLKNTNLNSRINTSRLPFSVTHTRERFSYTVKVTGYNQRGEFVDRYVGVTTNSAARTRAQIETTGLEYVSEEGRSDTLTDAKATIHEGRQRVPVTPK